jgi:DNA-binding NarL/FixJ family response regulator
MKPIRVLIVDDQTLLRQGLQTLLEMQDGIRIVGQAGDGVDALAQADALKPDVVLMDVRMPRMDGVEATRQIRARLPAAQVIILTTFDDDEYVFDGLRAGATGYLLKDVSAETIADAIRRVARGEALIQPSIARKVVAEFTRLGAPTNRPQPQAQPSSPDALSEREAEILRLLAQGLANREIADKLFITEGTVKNHVSNILAKLNVRDRTQAVLKAKENGWV